MDKAVAVVVVMVMSYTCPFSLAFWYSLHIEMMGFTVPEEAGICKCGLLLSNPISDFVGSHCAL